MNIEILTNIAVVLIALVIVLAIGLWALNSMMDDSDDAEPTLPTDADRYNQSKRGGK